MSVNLVLVLVQLIMASLAVLGRLVLPVVPAAVLVLFRISGAALVLLLMAWRRPVERVRAPLDLLRLAAVGWLGVTANQTLFLMGLARTSAVTAAVLITTIPVFTVLISLLAGRERASMLKLVGIGVAGAGAIYLVGPDRVRHEPDSALGTVFLLVGMLCYAAYLVFAKPLLVRYRPRTVVTYVMAASALGVLPIGLPAIAKFDLGSVPAGTWLLVCYIVLGPTLLAYFLNIWALRRVSSHAVASYIYLQPVFAAIASVVLLPEERLTLRTVGAALLIFAGLGQVILAEWKEGVSPPPPPGAGQIPVELS
ncbi:MAG TPA: DMT family transporter [Gemmatimonadales bacterium]|nr:DMT family transporter [Gemmatimonadales bacterium]